MATTQPTGVSVDEVFEILQQKHRDVDLLPVFHSEFFERTNEISTNKDDWHRNFLGVLEATDFMRAVTHILENLATRLARTKDDPVYAEATTLAQTVQSILVERYGFEPCTIRIMSPSRQMEEAGLVDIVTGEDGEEYIQLTSRGNDVAKAVRDEISPQ